MSDELTVHKSCMLQMLRTHEDMKLGKSSKRAEVVWRPITGRPMDTD
jgi:hypothetical protein